ncbi:hypothetical protein [Leptothoe sp. PORK10 BA2]|uniref:hypothetical protein n=1 Tax=Leptothoe sp. PORK10 BA2 TaxID=3110254 RepID=UPI002B20FAA2|nr:hypothetical protein [Leptothoe sp. PORK10 BA2]MEA5466585.1 hypothetical protein [Leptothoe sp. PORK10 BA2]
MRQRKVIKKRIVTANGHTIAEATSVMIISDDHSEETTTYQQMVEVEVSPNQVTSYAASHASVVIE